MTLSDGTEFRISETAEQRGFGQEKYKSVVGLSREERGLIERRGAVFFRSRPSGGNHGTTWRQVMAYRDYTGRLRFYPRVPSAAYLKDLS